MAKIPPMTLEDYLQTVAVGCGVKICTVAQADGGGFIAYPQGPSNRSIGWGDTVGQALRAAHDSHHGRASRHSRLNPPYLSSDREAKRWDKGCRINYDYRQKDWEPPI